MGEESLPFLKIEKKCLDFWKIGPDCIHLWVTFYIQNIFLRVSMKKLQNVCLWGLFLCFWPNIYQSEPFISLANLETCHIQNPGIFRTQGIFSFLSRHILAYSECSNIENPATFRTLPYSEFWNVEGLRHIQNPVYIGTFRYIQTYSKMIVIITFTSSFLL